MSFVTRLLSRLRTAELATGNRAAEDVFSLRLARMQARSRVACQQSPFRNSRQHPAA